MSATASTSNAKKTQQNLLWTILNFQLTKVDLYAIKIKKKDLTFVLRNLATLVENGLSLPKALATLAKERSLKKYRFNNR